MQHRASTEIIRSGAAGIRERTRNKRRICANIREELSMRLKEAILEEMERRTKARTEQIEAREQAYELYYFLKSLLSR